MENQQEVILTERKPAKISQTTEKDYEQEIQTIILSLSNNGSQTIEFD